jgi:hypothetical protein
MQFRREKCHRTSTLYRLVFYEMIFITYFTTTTSPTVTLKFFSTQNFSRISLYAQPFVL